MSDFNKTFSSLLESGKLPHAIILEGEDDQTCEAAKLLSAAVVCENIGGDRPCFKCSACLKAMADTQSEQSAHPDILVYSGKDTPRSFRVDTVREIRQAAFVMPNEANCKVFVLLKAHSMGVEAQNALLKILEEPPEYAVFILTCVSRSRMLQTILSRCTCFSFENPCVCSADEEILSLSEQMAAATLSESEWDLLKLTSEFDKDNKKFKSVVSQFILTVSDAVIIKCGSKATLYSGQEQAAKKLAAGLTVQALSNLTDVLQGFVKAVDTNANNNLLITAFCAGVRKAIGK